MASFDSFNFVSDVGKSISGIATTAAGVSKQGMGALSSALSGNGLSLDGIKNFVTNKTDSLSLGQNFNRAGLNMFSSRSQTFNTSNDPSTVLDPNSSIWSAPIKYPVDNLRTEFFTIDFAKYKRPSNFDKGSFSSVLQVHLPIPRNLSEQHTIDVAPTSLKTIGAAVPIVENLLSEAQGSGRATKTEYAEDAIGLGYSVLANKVSQTNVLGFSGEQLAGLGGQFLGAIPNPHISVFFNGVDLRPAIEFSWLFTPKSAEDSGVLKDLLKQIKSLVLPAISQGNGNVMDYPHMVKIEIHGLDPDTTPLYKRGLITAININYTPNGPSFFKGTNAPTFVAFSFLFQEIEIITANDYGAEASSSIESIKKGYNTLKSGIEQTIAKLT